jgi:hypothetical protein
MQALEDLYGSVWQGGYKKSLEAPCIPTNVDCLAYDQLSLDYEIAA